MAYRLSILYPLKEVEVAIALLCGLLLIVVTILALRQIGKMPWLAVGWLWFLGTFVPVIGFVTFGHFFVADRYTYIPSIGLTMAVVLTVEYFVKNSLPAGKIAIAFAAAVLFGYGLVTLHDLPRWKDSMALYDAALRVGPHHITYNNRGTAFVSRGDQVAALEDFTRALRLKPDYANAYCNRASCYMEIGDFDAAIKDCSKALEFKPIPADAFNNRGNAYARKGESQKALDDYTHAIKLNSKRPLFYNNRAAAYFDLKQFDKALADLRTCEQLGGEPHPGLVTALQEAMPHKP